MRKLETFGMVLLLSVFVASGCGKSTSDNDAIRSAINAHVSSRSNLNPAAFDTEIKKVNVQGDQATADVAFKVKGGPGEMNLTYNLKKTGGSWAVVESNPVGSNFTHPALDGAGGPGTAPGASPGTAPGSGAPGDIVDAVRQKMATPAK